MLAGVATRLRGAVGSVIGVGALVCDASRRFGEPVPAPVTTDGVAFASRRLVIVAGVAVGSAASSRAAAPATCGAAIEVPEIVLVAVVEDHQADRTADPGANRSTQVPWLE